MNMSMRSQHQNKAVASLVSYRPALGKVSGEAPIRLSANEGALGWSPQVEKCLRGEMSTFRSIIIICLNQQICMRQLPRGTSLTQIVF